MVDFRSLVPWRSEGSQPTERRSNLADPFAAFRHEMDRMFDDFFGHGSRTGMQALTPAVDVEEKDKEVVVTAELPGVSEKDIEVNLSRDVLTIRGEKKAEREENREGSRYVERRFGSFTRALRLPFDVKDEQVDANFSNGVLTIRVPKPAEIQTQAPKIEIKAA